MTDNEQKLTAADVAAMSDEELQEAMAKTLGYEYACYRIDGVKSWRREVASRWVDTSFPEYRDELPPWPTNADAALGIAALNTDAYFALERYKEIKGEYCATFGEDELESSPHCVAWSTSPARAICEAWLLWRLGHR